MGSTVLYAVVGMDGLFFFDSELLFRALNKRYSGGHVKYVLHLGVCVLEGAGELMAMGSG